MSDQNVFGHLDWPQIRQSYDDSDEAYVVIDSFLPTVMAHQLHKELVQNPMWRIKNPVSKHLHNRQPKTNMTRTIVPELQHIFAQHFDAKLQVDDFWAMMYSRNSDGNVHADFGDLTLTYWLTPEEFNKDPGTGGLILYDVRRPDGMKVNEFLSAGEASARYVQMHSSGDPTTIPYRFNRAVLFNPRIFHKSDSPHFDITDPMRMRLNLTLSFSDLVEARRKLEEIA